MTKPQTQFVLVRSSRKHQSAVQIVSNDGSFDFSDYTYLRMSPATVDDLVEEWVYKDDLELYTEAMKENNEL